MHKNRPNVSATQFTIKHRLVASAGKNKLCGNKMKPVAEIRRLGKAFVGNPLKLGEP